MRVTISLMLLVCCFLLTKNAAAESATWEAKNEDKRASNELLPGEQVTTPSGQKMKVWSTAGPVKVERAPEPFDDERKTLLNDANIDIDVEDRSNHLHDPR